MSNKIQDINLQAEGKNIPQQVNVQMPEDKEGFFSKAWHGITDFIGISSPAEREKEKAAAFSRMLEAQQKADEYMKNNLGFLKQTDFAVDDKSLAKLKGFLNDIYKNDEIIKENINKAGGKVVGGQVKGLNQSGFTKLIGKDVENYYMYYNQAKEDLLNKLTEQLGKLWAQKKSRGEKITEKDIEDILENNEELKSIANNLAFYNRSLNNNINWKIYDKTIGDESWLTKSVHFAEMGMGELTTDFANVFQGVVNTLNKGVKFIGDKISKIPVVGEVLSLPDKAISGVLDYEERAQTVLGGLEARLNNKGILGKVERIGMPIVGVAPYIAPVGGGLGATIKTARILEDVFTAATKSKAAGKILGLAGGSLIGTELFLDGIINTATQTAITPKQVQTDLFYNTIFTAVGEGILGTYKYGKQYIDNKLEQEILNKTITINTVEKGSNEIVQKQLKLGDIFDNIDDVVNVAMYKGKADIKSLTKYMEDVQKTITELTTQGKEKEVLAAKRVFNKKIALLFSDGNKDLVRNALRANKTKEGTEQFFENAQKALNAWIDAKKELLKKLEKDLAEQEAEIARKKAEQVKLQEENAKQRNVQKIATILTAIKTASSKKIFQEYMSGLNEIEVATKEGIRKLKIRPKIKAQIEYDIINKGQISRDTINEILKDINKSLLGGKGTINLSDYLVALKKFLGTSKDFVDDNLKLVLSQSEHTIDAYDKLINTVMFEKTPQIGKTTNKVGAKIDLVNSIIRLGTAYKEFGDVADFGVILIHELTHLTEPALRQVWGEELVSKLKKEWGHVVQMFNFANLKEDIKPFKSRQEIVKYLEEYMGGEHIDNIVDFNIRLMKSVREGYITQKDANEFLLRFDEIRDDIDNQLIIKHENDTKLLERMYKESIGKGEVDPFIQIEHNLKKRIAILQEKEKRLGYVANKKIKDPDALKKQIRQLEAEKEKVKEDIMQIYNVDQYRAAEIYDEFVDKISVDDLKVIKDYDVLELLYEITSTDKVNGRYRGFSEYLAYMLSNKLIKGDIGDNNVFKEFVRGVEVNDEYIRISPKHLEEAAKILLEKKFKGLDEYIILSLKDAHNVLYNLKKTKGYKKLKEYIKMVSNNIQQFLKNPSVDSMLHYLSNLNEKDFVKQVYDKGIITQKELYKIIDKIGFENVKKFMGNGLLLGLRGKDGIVAGGIWEGMVKGAKSMLDYKINFREIFARQLTDEQLKNIPNEIKEQLFKQDLGINDFFTNLKILLDRNESKEITKAVGDTLEYMYKNIIYKTPEIFETLLKLDGLSQEEDKMLRYLAGLYKANVNYYMDKLLKSFKDYSPEAFNNLIKEKPQILGIYKSIKESVKKSDKEVKEILEKLYRQLGKQGVVDLGYIIRVGRSESKGYNKINLTSVKNTVNLSLFNSIVNKLGYKSDEYVFNEFINKVRERAIKQGIIPADSFDINSILRFFGYEFKGTKKGLKRLVETIHNVTKNGYGIDMALYSASMKIKGLEKVETKTINVNQLLNYLLLKANDATTYVEALKKGQFTYEDYINLIFDVFDKDIAKGLAEKILQRSRNTIIKRNGLEYFRGLKQYVNDTYQTYNKIYNDVQQALEDIGEHIDIMKGKYNDIPNELQRLNVHYSGIGGVETLSIINKNGIAYQLEKRDGKWILLSKGNATAFSINKTSPLSNIFNQSELDFMEGIDNIKNVSSIKNIKNFINNCL